MVLACVHFTGHHTCPPVQLSCVFSVLRGRSLLASALSSVPREGLQRTQGTCDLARPLGEFSGQDPEALLSCCISGQVFNQHLWVN